MDRVYTDHLKLRLKSREIPWGYPKIILENPEKQFFDVLKKRIVSIKRLKYDDELRNMMIAYEIKNDIIEIVTIHPIRDDQIINRIRMGRWIKNEKI